MTSLKKVVERASYGTVREAGKNRRIIVMVRPPNVLGFRAKGCRREYQLTMESCYLMAVRAGVESERRKTSRYRQREVCKMNPEIVACETHIEMLLDTEEQTRIGINPNDLNHVRPLNQKVLRILTAYNEIWPENKRLRDLLCKYVLPASADLIALEKGRCYQNPTVFNILAKMREQIEQAFIHKQSVESVVEK